MSYFAILLQALLAAIALSWAFPATAQQDRAVVALPGRGNLLFLPLELAKKIGADRKHGIDLELHFMPGGPKAYQYMIDRNCDFSAGGLSALALQRANGKPVKSVVAMSQVPGYTLLVSSKLKGKVRKVADLKGRLVGVKGYAPGGRSTSQLFSEYIVSNAGLARDSVNFVATGQTFDDQHAALASGAVDALMGDEPFASRMIKEGNAFALADFHDLPTIRRLLGGLFLNSQVATRDDVIANRPELVHKVVATIRTTLEWIASHSAEEISRALELGDPVERDALTATLRRYKSMYSPNGAFSDEQIKTAERFFRATTRGEAGAEALDYGSIFEPRWAGRSK